MRVAYCSDLHLEFKKLELNNDVGADVLVLAGDVCVAESIRRFPPMPEFERMIRAAGFARTKVEPILGGLVAIHSGWKV